MAVKAAKTMSTISLHLVVAVAVGYALTGSLVVSGAVALIEPICNVIVQHFHEKAWARVQVA